MKTHASGLLPFQTKHFPRWVALVVASATTMVCATGLYDTGPGQDSSFIRFVNGADAQIVISNNKTKGKLTLSTQGASRVSSFLPIRPGVQMPASISVGNQKFDIQVVAKPGEFITVATVPDGAGRWKSLELRETPASFSSTRPSLAALNLNEVCSSMQIDSAGKNDGILKNATTKAIQRRLVSAVNAQVQLSCEGKPVGVPLDMGLLEAGERYSVFMLPNQVGALSVKDVIETGN
jgi:alginate O-acetyltransferase complex protein AlgF